MKCRCTRNCETGHRRIEGCRAREWMNDRVRENESYLLVHSRNVSTLKHCMAVAVGGIRLSLCLLVRALACGHCRSGSTGWRPTFSSTPRLLSCVVTISAQEDKPKPIFPKPAVSMFFVLDLRNACQE